MDTPLNKAHAHAMNAEEYKTRGLLVKAAEEHYLAAELFKRAMESSSAEGTKRTLRMLYQDHNNSGKELQRKIAELEAQGKDPSAPQPQPPRRSSSSSSIMSQLATPSQHHYPPTSRSTSRLGESQMAIGDSYMMLEGQNPDAADPFKDFWENVEGLLHRFSSPVAFATAPLSPRSSRLSSVQSVSSTESSDTEDVLGPTVSTKIQPKVLESLADALGEQANQTTLNDSLSSTLKPRSNTKNGKAKATIPDESFDDDGSSSDSFLVIPASPNVRTLQAENAKIKEQLKATESRLAAAEQHIKMRADQEQQLREGILNARQQMQQRLGSSTVLPQPIVDMSFPNLKLPTVPGITPLAVPALTPLTGPPRDRETTLLRRTRELEDELRVTREENEKLRAQILKFRERWAKLKESAKRKRSARAAAEAGRIDEEPEGEAEADENDAKN